MLDGAILKSMPPKLYRNGLPDVVAPAIAIPALVVGVPTVVTTAHADYRGL